MEESQAGEGKPLLATIKYLRENGIEALTKEFALSTCRHEQHPHLVQIKYDQLESPFESPIVQECRGLILDESNNWDVVCYPFLKFFNYGEEKAAKIDWTGPVKVMDKVDGSLVSVYYYSGAWHIASSSVPDGRGALWRTSKDDPDRKTFSTLFREIWAAMKYAWPSNTSYCYMFELFSTENRIIVKPLEETIIFTGARDLNTYKELDPLPIAEEHGWRLPKTYEYHSIEEVKEAAAVLDPSFREGFVVCDQHFNRVKIKCPQYVAVSLLSRKDKGQLNTRRMLEIVKVNEGSEFLTYFPEWAELFTAVKQRYDELISSAEAAWVELADIEDPTEFGKAAVGRSRYQEYLFTRRKGTTHSAKHFYGTICLQKRLISLLDVQLKEIPNTLPDLTIKRE